MLEDKVKMSIQFSDELSKWFDRSLNPLFNEVMEHDDDLDLFNDEEPLITIEGQDVIVSENKIKAKIAELILENRVNDMLFEIEYKKSASVSVEGYQ